MRHSLLSGLGGDGGIGTGSGVLSLSAGSGTTAGSSISSGTDTMSLLGTSVTWTLDVVEGTFKQEQVTFTHDLFLLKALLAFYVNVRLHGDGRLHQIPHPLYFCCCSLSLSLYNLFSLSFSSLSPPCLFYLTFSLLLPWKKDALTSTWPLVLQQILLWSDFFFFFCQIVSLIHSFLKREHGKHLPSGNWSGCSSSISTMSISCSSAPSNCKDIMRKDFLQHYF